MPFPNLPSSRPQPIAESARTGGVPAEMLAAKGGIPLASDDAILWGSMMADERQDPSNSVERLAKSVDARFDAVDARFDAVEDHLSDLREYIDFGHFKLQEHITGTSNELRLDVKGDISRLERKLDQFIDSQLKR